MTLVSLAERCAQVSPFLVMEILHKAQTMQESGIDVIHLEIGEPDFDTPTCIIEAGKNALDEGKTHYTASQGTAQLQEAVATHYNKHYNVTIAPEQVLIFSGSSPAMYLVFSALLSQNDEVIISNPSYACYSNFVRFTGAQVREVLTYEEDGFQFKTDDLAMALNEKTKAILINSPANPTGIVMDKERMEAIVKVRDDFAKTNNGLSPLIISDEIYHGLSYGKKNHSILEFTQNALVFNGFSKAYAMTGWRLGYCIVPKEYVKPLTVLMQNFFLSTNTMAQCAGVHALTHAEKDVQAMREAYNERRVYLLTALRELGFHIPVEPEGAFYVLVNARHLAKRFNGSSIDLTYDILNKAHVAVTPGSEFGSQTEGYLRLSYANSLENLQKAMQRLKDYIESEHA